MTPYYEQDGIVIYHGDCRYWLQEIGAVDLLLTDPPYGIGEARGKNKSRTRLAVAKDYGVSDWDNEPPPRWLLDLARSMASSQINLWR